jgi:hypothetical protein
MDAGINNVIYMELYSGPKMANDECGKTIDTGTIDRGSTVHSCLCSCAKEGSFITMFLLHSTKLMKLIPALKG